jgi:putative ABC transport system permease protein
MSTMVRQRPAGTGKASGGMAARRAVIRWAWRLFRREWRQQLLVVALLTVAVAVTIVGSAAAINIPPPANSGFGTAADMATLTGTGPHLAAQIASLEHRFGQVDVIENQTQHVPGSISTYQLRAQNPGGPFGGPMLSLISGHYPSAADQVAITPGVASELNLKIGQAWRAAGVTRQVVGIVQNPQSLLDEFALVPPGQVRSPDQVTVLFDAPGVNPSSIGPNVTTPGASVAANAPNPEVLSLAVLTIGMILIALMAVGGFTVLAQRRLRSLGMLASVGATGKNVSLVVRANGVVAGAAGALTGTVLGLVLWLVYRPRLEQSAHHVIGVLALPWAVIAAAIALALVAAYWAASRPARAIARLSVMAALSGRPAPPKRVHRSALPGIAFLVIAFLLLGYSGGTSHGAGSAGAPELVLGIVALIPAVILLAPFCLAVLGGIARRTPVATRIALRDLARYRARSGSALAAVSIGVMIAVIIAVVAQVRYSDVWDPAGPNLASNQAVIWTGSPNPSPSALKAMAKSADRVGAALGARYVAAREQTSANLQNSSGTKSFDGSVDVATPQLLQALGISPSAVDPQADIVTSLPGFAGASGVKLSWCEKLVPLGAGNFSCAKSGELSHPVIQDLSTLPTGVHAPNTLITEHAVHALGLSSSITTYAWLAQSAGPLTAAEIRSAQEVAATAGLSVETRNDQPTSAEVIGWATVFGIVLALCILAMSVGLIRSETAGDLRTLAATGASSYTRRTLTAATAGALGLLGAILGTFAGYVGVIGWLRANSLHGGLSSLGDVPVPNLLAIVLGLPLLAAAIGWVLAGRQPAAMSRQPIE